MEKDREINAPTKTIIMKDRITFFAQSAMLCFAFLCMGLLPQHAQAQLNNFKKVKITTVQLIPPVCGGKYIYSTNLDVENGNHGGGWIIQEIKYKRWVAGCPPIEFFTYTKLTYYEAWWVPAGTTRGLPMTTTTLPGGGQSQPASDFFWSDIPNNTYGEASWRGKVAFVEDPQGTMIQGGGWARGGVPQAGSLPATRIPPPFWNALAQSGKLTNHNAFVGWNCCFGPPYTTHSEKDDAPEAIPPEDLLPPRDEKPRDGETGGGDDQGNDNDTPPGEGNGGIQSNQQASFQVYQPQLSPNPSKGQFYLSVKTASTDQVIEINVRDLQGRLVEVQRQGLNGSTHFRTEADLSNHPNGWYVVSVLIDGQLVGTEKLMLTH